MTTSFAQNRPLGRRASATLLATALMLLTPVVPRPTAPADPGDTLGRGGWGSIGACLGCGAGALFIASGGPAAVALALHVPGSLLIIGGCVAACYDAVQ